jgi:hypothetical protein
LDARFLGVEVEYQVIITVPINVLDVTLAMRLCSSIWAKLDAQGINSGGIEGIGSEDSYTDYPFALRINAVREAARLDVDSDFHRRWGS